MALYDLTGDIKRLYEMAEEDGNITEFQDAYSDTMEALQGEFDEKVASTARFIRDLEADADAINSEVLALKRKESSIEKRIKWLREYLLKNMEEAGRTQSGDAVTTVRIRRNGGKLPLVFNKGVEIPQEYQKAEYSPDNDKIREELESGKVLPFVRLGERAKSIMIK